MATFSAVFHLFFSGFDPLNGQNMVKMGRASVTQAQSLGAVVVFADIDINTLCLDPEDIEHRITPKVAYIDPN